MNKCQHGQKINAFCASECCVWKDVGGCENCMKKYHNHMGPTVILKEEEILAMVKKYNMDQSIKPSCRAMQEAIYNYFNLIKTEVTTSIDATCKNIINQIGYPFLYHNNHLNVYKRLKNKQYKKLVQKQFKALNDLNQKVSEKDLMKEEASIYINSVKNITELLNNFEGIIKNYQTLIKKLNPTFQHDGSLMLKINQIIKNIKLDSPSKKEKRDSKSTTKDQSLSIPDRIQKRREEKQSQTQREKDNIKQSRQIKKQSKNNSRDVSLDKKLVKQHNFDSKKLKSQKKPKEKKQKSQKQIKQTQKMDKMQTIKKELDEKQVQINQRKKVLINLMKQKQDSIKNEKNYTSLTVKEKELNPIKKDKSDYLQVLKKQIKEDSMNDVKSLNNSSDDESLIKGISSEIKPQAFTTLPLEDSSKDKIQDKEHVKRRMIVIPRTDMADKNDQKIEEIHSPMLKKKSILERFEEFKIQEIENIEQKTKTQTTETNPPSVDIKPKSSPKKVQKQLEVLDQNEQKSIALLMKSLHLKAQQAIPLLQSSLKYAENNLSAVQYLTYLYLQVNKPKECLTLCNKSLDKMQNSNQPEQLTINIQINKTAALNILGRYSESIVILEKCLRYRVKDTLHKNLGDAYFSISIYQKAVYNYEKALAINNQYDEAHFNLAVCLYIQGNFFNAKLAIKKAIEMQPLNEFYRQLESNIETKIKSF